AEAKGLRLTMTLHGDDAQQPAVFALDEVRLGQVLLNLLSNAVKFTTVGEVSARMALDPSTGTIRFEIDDTGIGIAPEVQSRLFQRFSQADSSISRSYGGAGLGLAISKALIGQMGGQIGVESVPDLGSRFWITLPATPVETRQAPAVVDQNTLVPAAFRILLVDDHPMNRELGHALLTLAGCVVTTAEDGAQAVDAARDGGFDLILMDMFMPGCTGVEATRVIRQHAEFLSTPIIYLSGDTNVPLQVDALRLGGDHFLTKPYNPVVLNAIVKSKIERYRALRRSMVRDSLTGLFNHITAKERLTQALHAAQAENSALSVAMIDIDHFKQVNDDYGHQSGDHVIRYLAWFLKQRLRKTDLVGRYGGEEFLVVLPGADAEQAITVLERIRQDFSQIRHPFNETWFNTTFSGGVSEFPSHTT
ncbi:MAG: hypothetical protein B7X77_04200, partial [Caulobacter sp. 39-67-4]